MNEMPFLGPLARTFRTAAVLGIVGLAAYAALPGLRELVLVAPPESGATAVTRASAAPAPRIVAKIDGSVTISLTDAQLTALAQPYFPQSALGFTVSDPHVRATTGHVVLTATAQSFFGSGPLVATSTPVVSAGRLLLHIDSVTVGGTTMPQAISDQIAQQLQSAIDSAIGAYVRVTSVSAESGTLTVGGVPLS